MNNLAVKKVWVLFVLTMLISISSGCQQAVADQNEKPLSSWNDTELKTQILEYITYASKNIPEEERIAVFDMDGTVICEKPVWIEMDVALNHMYEEVKVDPSLMDEPLYKIAYTYEENPTEENWKQVEANVTPILMQSFVNETQESYVSYASTFAVTHENPDYNIKIEETFYKPMVELIEHLKTNGFQVYIVSGSEEGLIWAVAPEPLGLSRNHLIGTRIQLKADYNIPGVFIREDGIYDPKNLKDGKSENIYFELGAKPVFACGNTVDDFGMLSYTTSNEKYETLSLLVNHDDANREYKYPVNERHEGVDWKKIVDENGWNVISMKSEFKEVFMK